MDKSEIIESFKDNKSRYDNAMKKIIRLINELLEGIDCFSITGRIKELESLDKKISTKNKYYYLDDITDIIGIRIMTYLPSHIDKVVEVLSTHFDVDKNSSIDKRYKEIDQFGYSSYHLIAKIKEDRANLHEYRTCKDIKFEIQVRTILQHVWAEIEHDIGYKSNIVIPDHMRRRFYRLASILELADEEFENIVREKELYSRNVGKSIVNNQIEGLKVDYNSIQMYIENSILFEKMIEKLKIELPSSFECTMDYTKNELERLVKLLISFGIETIEEIDSALSNNFDFIATYLLKDFATPDEKYNKLAILFAVIEFIVFEKFDIREIINRFKELYDVNTSEDGLDFVSDFVLGNYKIYKELKEIIK